MRIFKRSLLVCFMALTANLVGQNLPKTPIMGWSSWNHYRIHINDSIIRSQADAMVTSGLLDVGYQFVNIDDGFFGGRSGDGTLYCDSTKFPLGMKSLADYIRAKGLKPGIYSDAGSNTCGSIWDNDPYGFGVGAFGHEQRDMVLFLKTWGYDFIKVDWCGGQQQKLDEEQTYSALIEVVRQTRPDVVFNICRWQFPGTWALPIADSWRISGDIEASFHSICAIIDRNAYLAPYASPGHFNDMDMLQVGRGMTPDEDRAHFSMWCMMVSPLLAGNDLGLMSDETRDILANRALIAINQDPAAIQAERVWASNGVEVWVKPLGNRLGNERTVAIFNRNEKAVSHNLDFSSVGLQKVKSVSDLWLDKSLKVLGNALDMEVPAHGIRVFKVKGGKVLVPDSYEAEYAFLNHMGAAVSPTIVADKGFFGGHGVAKVGGYPDNWMEFRHVYAPKAKKVKLVVAPGFVPGSSFEMTVNGVKCKFVDGGWIVDLIAGFNVVRLSDDKQELPVLDRLQVLDVKK